MNNKQSFKKLKKMMLLTAGVSLGTLPAKIIINISNVNGIINVMTSNTYNYYYK